MKKSTITFLAVISILILSSCYNYYVESRTDDYATILNVDGSSKVVGSGQFSVFVQDWNKDVCEGRKNCSFSYILGKRSITVGQYFTDCPDFVLTCGID